MTLTAGLTGEEWRDLAGGVLLGLICMAAVCRVLQGLSRLDGASASEEQFCRVSCGQICLLCALHCPLFGLLGWERAAPLDSLLSFLFLGMVAGSLLCASIMDMETHMVYDYVWWAGMAAALSLLFLSGGLERSRAALPLAVFLLLQEGLFGRFYGRADCHAFCLCAVAESAWGLGFLEYLLHMLLALLLLAAVQLLKGNVTPGGKLKESVPFVPYIQTAFWVVLAAGY